MGTPTAQKVDLASQVAVGGNVRVSTEKRVGILRAYAGSDVALAGLLLSLCLCPMPELYLFGGMGGKPLFLIAPLVSAHVAFLLRPCEGRCVAENSQPVQYIHALLHTTLRCRAWAAPRGKDARWCV